MEPNPEARAPENVSDPLSGESSAPSDAAVAVFGSQASLAARYEWWLRTAGITRGLIGPREGDKLWDRHILNSAVCAVGWPTGITVADIGSGAGLPGIPMAILRPDIEFVLIEPLLRRTTFLTEVVEDLGLTNVSVLRGRAEDSGVVAASGEGFDIVTSRAVAPLAKLGRWSLPLVRSGGSMKALKGVSASEEIERDRALLYALGASAIELELYGQAEVQQPTQVVTVRKK